MSNAFPIAAIAALTLLFVACSSQDDTSANLASKDPPAAEATVVEPASQPEPQSLSDFRKCEALKAKKEMKWGQSPYVIYSDDPSVTGTINPSDLLQIRPGDIWQDGQIRVQVHPSDNRTVGKSNNLVWIDWGSLERAGTQNDMFSCEYGVGLATPAPTPTRLPVRSDARATPRARSTPALEVIYETSVRRILDAYESNALAAESKYKDKVVNTEGFIESVERDSGGVILVEINPSKKFSINSVICGVAEDELSWAQSLFQGALVKFRGVVVDYSYGDVYMVCSERND